MYGLSVFTIDKLFRFGTVFLKECHIRTGGKQRRNGDVAIGKRNRVAVHIVRTFVGNRFAFLHVNIPFAVNKPVGEIRRALIGNTNPLRLVGDVDVEQRTFVQHLVFHNVIVHFVQVFHRVFLSVG